MLQLLVLYCTVHNSLIPLSSSRNNITLNLGGTYKPVICLYIVTLAKGGGVVGGGGGGIHLVLSDMQFLH